MNEASQPAAPAADKKSLVTEYFKKLHEDGKLTRIPVSHLFFAENIDHSGGWENQFSNAACIRPAQANPVARYYVCDFIPAWQVFEFTAVASPDATPKTEYLPAVHVRRWKRG